MIVDVLWEPHLPDNDAQKSLFSNSLFCGRKAFEKYVGRSPMIFDTSIAVQVDMSKWLKAARTCDCKIPTHETWCEKWKRYEDTAERE